MNQIRLFAASRNRTIFLFEYVEGVASVSLRREGQLTLPDEFPLIVSWSTLSSKYTRDNYKKLDQDQYHILLEESRIVYMPFDRLSPDFLPAYLRAQIDAAYTHTLLIGFEQMACHMPHVCPAKMGLVLDDIVELPPPPPPVRIVRRTYPGKQDWALKFAEHISCWNNRRLRYICQPQRLHDLGIIMIGKADEETNIGPSDVSRCI